MTSPDASSSFRKTRALVVALLVGAAGIAAGLWLFEREAPSADSGSPGASALERSGGKAARNAQREPGAPDEAIAPASAKAAPEVAIDGQLVVSVVAAAHPVARAKVRLYWRASGASGGAWSNGGEGITGEDGVARLPARPGAYLVSARGGGFAAGRAEVSHPAGGAQTRVQVELSQGVTLTGLTVDWKSRAPVPLAELVLSPQLRPFPRDRVELPDEERVTAASDTRGRFQVSGLAPGRWMLEARAASYAPAVVRNLQLPRGELVVEMEGAGTLEGTVRREGKPVPGAVVTVTGSGDPVTAETGPAGAYSAPVQPGTHHVTAREGDDVGAASAAVIIAAGATARGIDVELAGGASIAGHVHSSAGPVAGATIEASPHRESGSSGTAASGDDGAYELRALAPGSYDIEVKAAGHGRYDARGITVRSGERFPLDILLPGLTAIEGNVTLVGGAPAAGAIVSVMDGFGGGPGGGPGGGFRGGGGPGGGGFMRNTPSGVVADSQGHFRVEGISPGRAVVSAKRDEGSPAASRMVQVEEGDTAHADLALVEGGLVTGTVVDSQGKLVPGALVIAMDPSGGGGMRGFGGGGGQGRNTASADASGAFMMALTPGAWGLSALRATTGPGPGFAVGGPPQILTTANVTVGKSAEVVITLPPEIGNNATGHVLEPGGSPSPGAMVRISSTDAPPQAVNADGSGNFTLRISPDVTTDITARNGGRSGTLTAAAGATDVTIQLQPGAKLTGTVLGDPVPDSYTVSPRTQSPGQFGPGGGQSPKTFSGADPFEFDDQPPGLIAVHVRTDDGRVGDAQANAASGETANVQVTLSPAAFITGHVVDANTNQPLPWSRSGGGVLPTVAVDNLPARPVMNGVFQRTISVGQHQVTVTAKGYQPTTVSVNAAGTAQAPTDMGTISLTPTAPPTPPTTPTTP